MTNNCRVFSIDIPTADTSARPPARGNNGNIDCNGIIRATMPWLVSLTMIICFAIVAWLLIDVNLYTRDEPNFHIDYILVSPLNISNSQVSTNWTIGILVQNPNKRTHIAFDGLQVSLFYETDQNLCSTRIGPFHQGPKNTTMLIAKSEECLQDLSDVIANVMSVNPGDLLGLSNFDVRMWVRYRFIDPLRWLGALRFRDHVLCNNLKVLPATNGSQSRLIGSSECFISHPQLS